MLKGSLLFFFSHFILPENKFVNFGSRAVSSWASPRFKHISQIIHPQHCRRLRARKGARWFPRGLGWNYNEKYSGLEKHFTQGLEVFLEIKEERGERKNDAESTSRNHWGEKWKWSFFLFANLASTSMVKWAQVRFTKSRSTPAIGEYKMC